MSDLSRSPNVFHPTRPSAVGSRNSLAQDGRDQKQEYDQLVQEETERILDTIQTKLPAEVLERLDVMGGLKEKLYNYFNQNYQNMFNRYITTTEDEMVKKIRNFIDKEENKTLARYTPKEIAAMLDEIAGADKFNTGEVEKSIVNMYGHLHGHIQRGVNDLENETNSLLRQKTDVGAFIRGENAYSVVKAAFKDSATKPKTVTDTKLSVNILDSELISPIFQYQATVEYLIKDQISRTISNLIDQEVERFQDELIDQGKEELTDSEIIFEKMKRVTNYTDDDVEDETSKRYTFLAKELMQKIEGLRAEIDPSEFDPVNIRENLKKIIDMENIRNRGFNTAVNSITSILDTSKMGYQYVENLKNARELIIREYEDTDVENLPDERYQIRLKYYDSEQLEKEREVYDQQMEAFRQEIQKLYDVIEAVYQTGRSRFKVNDYEDIVAKMSRTMKKRRDLFRFEESGDKLVEEMQRTWNEITLLKANPTDVERLNQTYRHEKKLFKEMLNKSSRKLEQIYGYQNPQERVILDDRVRFLRKEFDDFDYLINPYHIQSGVVLDVDITSIKRKKFTLNGMANVLNEFLHGISKGFQDAAFAAFKRRRSTVRDDIGMNFSNDYDEPVAKSLPDQGAQASAPAPTETVSRTPAQPRGQADVSPGKGSISSDDLQEL
ncbi:cytochrome c oxidase subunit II [Alkalispirochaeta sphaeroplastigenens]|uniref:Cytochrome c oxidase subunit II n=1 Tax=Alkalispirochaeta sphaeroplastigenens TaxID=1187066 RepID=A0A2S4JGI7_9SPIO|nr:cytoplasmic filament protein CfpA [Alkalispirochaeta sphaeroplastigenens]POQ98668.1 cytochrome c oxidase subunit II [Alkalispirochaeta sphaeroplastigenens]